ncbi:MAG: Ig-like domain-containing protein [Actinomycetota bacterium]
MRTRTRFGRALPVLALIAGLAAVPAKADPPLIVVSITPGHTVITNAVPNITVKFNQCVLAPPSSSVELRSPYGTLVSVFVSFPNCQTIVLGPTQVLPSGQFMVHIFGITVGGASTSMTTVFFMDAVPPSPPDPNITHPINNANKTSVLVSGSGEPGSSVFVLIDDDNPATPAIACGTSGQPPCPTVGPQGVFSVGPFNVTSLDDSPPPSSAISTLTIVATVTLTDPGGNVSPPRYAYAYKDTVLPPPPVINFPANGAVNANQRWTMSGTASFDPGFRSIGIRIFDGDVAADSATAYCSALTCAWHKTLLFGPTGAHQMTARAVDAAGNLSAASNLRTLNVSGDTTNGPVRPSLDVTPNPVFPELSISGVAKVGHTVRFSINGAPSAVCDTAAPSGVPNYGCGPFPLGAVPAGLFNVTVSTPAHPDGGPTTIQMIRDGNSPANPTIQFTDPDPYVNAQEAVAVPLNGSAEPGATVSGTVISSGGGTSILFSTTVDAFGNWSAVTNVTTLNDGVLQATAIVTDSVGNVSGATNTASGPTLDKTPPPAPVILIPAEGSFVTSTTFPVSGTAGGGAQVVQIFEGTTLRASGTAAAFGGAGIATTLYVDGPKTIRARSIDQAGNFGPFSIPRNFFLDANPPELILVNPPNGGQTNPSGTITATYTDPDHANLGSCTLEVRDRGGSLAMGTVSIGGMVCQFQAAPNALTVAGSPYTATAQAADPLGNQSPPFTWQFSVDASPPPAPFISSPAEGALLNTASVQIQGTAEAGAQVQIFEGVTFLGATTANPFWTLTLGFADGPHTITAIAIDAAGNTGPGAQRSFIVDTVAPPAPVITSPAANATVAPNTPVTGTAVSGSTVKLFEGPVFLGQAVANPNWSITPSPSLPDGPHTVTAFAFDPAGNQSPGTSRTFFVDFAAPAQPIINTPTEGAYINTPTVTIAGTAEAGSTVRIFEGNTLLATQTALPAWSFTLPFTETTHTVGVDAVDSVNNVSTRAFRSFTVDLTAPAAPSIITPAAGSTQPGTFTVTGSGERLATVEVREGATLLGTATASAGGLWSMTISLTDGPHTITARQTDPAGNTGPFSPGRSFVVDAVPPAPPAITSPGNGDVRPANVVITGTGEPLATVTIKEGAVLVATAPVGAGGLWSVNAFFEVSGSHTIVAFQTDPAGNVGGNSALVTFTTDGIPPAVAIDHDAPYPALPMIFIAAASITGAASDNRGVTVIDVKIRDIFGAIVQTGAASCSCGPLATSVAWSYTPVGLLPGLYSIEVTARDQAGNISPPDVDQFITLV